MKIGFKFKKVLSFILTFSIIISIIPTAILPVSATTVTVLDKKISLTDTKNKISVSNNVVTITAKGGRSSQETNNVTITNVSDSKAKISFDYTVSNYKSHSFPQSSGTITEIVAPGESFNQLISITGKASTFSNTATLTLKNFSYEKIVDSAIVTFEFDPSKGSITVNGNAIDDGISLTANSDGLSLVATPKDGYTFLRWHSSLDGIFYYESNTTMVYGGDTTLTAEFVPTTDALFGVGNKRFADLNEACATASSGSEKTVVLLNNGTLAEGDYTIPSGVTLLIPRNEAATVNEATPNRLEDYTKPTAFRTLTMASGANIVVKGKNV